VRDIGDEAGQLDHVVEGRAPRRQTAAEVLEDLPRLRRRVALADAPAVLVEAQCPDIATNRPVPHTTWL
jgi:hypothetical protein